MVTPDLLALLEGAELPPAPPALDEGDEALVAILHDGNRVAVLLVAHDHAHDEPTEADRFPLSQYIEVYERQEGEWVEVAGAPGSSWPAPYGRRPTSTNPELTGFVAIQLLPEGGERWLRSGIAPSNATAVEVHAWVESHASEVDPATGAFLIVIAGAEEPRLTAVES
jgi:hypothetical protein